MATGKAALLQPTPLAQPTLGHAAQGAPSRRLFRVVQKLLKRFARRFRAVGQSWQQEARTRTDIGEFWLYVPRRLN